MNEKINEVLRTEDYSIFNYLAENRNVTNIRKKKVKKSIKENGYIFNPIIVNEKHEIIDGQARFEVLRELGMPIEYIVCEGLSGKDCAALNAYSTGWNTEDYIASYTQMGMKDYGYLFHLVNKYKPDGIGINSIIFAINGTVESQQNIVKMGSFKCEEGQYEEADKTLGYLRKFMPIIKRKNGHGGLIAIAIMFAYKMELVEPDRLLEKFNLYYTSDITPYYYNMETAFKALNEIYNYHRAKKIHLEIEYEKYQTGKYPWYKARFGKERSKEEE